MIAEPNPIILSSLDVPDENFEDGFTDSSGKTLNDINGNKLVQFFGLHINSNLYIPANMPAQAVQLAILSDDGSIVYTGTPGGALSTATNVLINNDGTRSNTLRCATQVIDMIPGVPVPIHVEYFQGPMVRIALSMFWRPQTDMSTQEPFCGVEEADSFYFTDSGNGAPPTPTSNYEALLSRGWQLIPATNYLLPTGVTNTCTMASPSPSPAPTSTATPTASPTPSPKPTS